MSVIMSSFVGSSGAVPGFVDTQSGFTLAEISLMAEMHAELVHAVRVDGTWSTSIDYHISLEPLGRRVRGYLGGVPVVDSLNARVMLEKGHLPVYYFTRADRACAPACGSCQRAPRMRRDDATPTHNGRTEDGER